MTGSSSEMGAPSFLPKRGQARTEFAQSAAYFFRLSWIALRICSRFRPRSIPSTSKGERDGCSGRTMKLFPSRQRMRTLPVRAASSRSLARFRRASE